MGRDGIPAPRSAEMAFSGAVWTSAEAGFPPRRDFLPSSMIVYKGEVGSRRACYAGGVGRLLLAESVVDRRGLVRYLIQESHSC